MYVVYMCMLQTTEFCVCAISFDAQYVLWTELRVAGYMAAKDPVYKLLGHCGRFIQQLHYLASVLSIVYGHPSVSRVRPV